MIPIRLKIEGMYSYQKPMEIDFKHLIEADLFGIFGATGSGKSTILEAISFALFESADRSVNIIEMINLRSSRLKVEYEFQQDQERFLFIREYKRKKSDFYKFDKLEGGGYRWQEGSWQPLEEKAEEIIGIDAANFHMTVIIPQGRFQDFLQSTPANRLQILQKLFNLDRFDLADKTKHLAGATSQELALLQREIQTIGEVNGEGLAALENQIKEKQELLATQEIELRAQEESLKALDELRKKVKSLSQWEKERAELEQNLSWQEGELLSREGNFQQLKNQYEQKEQQLAVIEQLKKLLEFKEKGQLVSKKEQDYGLLESTYQKVKEGLKSLKSALEEKKLQKSKLQQKLPSREALFQIKQWFDKNSELKKEVASQEGKLAKQRESLKALEKDQLELLDSLSYVPQNPANLGEELKEKLSILNEEIRHLQVGEKLAEFAKELKPGEPCPLCGALEHPSKYSAKAQEARLTEIEKEQRTLVEVREKWLTLQAKLEAEKNSFKSVETDLSEKKERLADWEKEFHWNEFSKEDRSGFEARFEVVQGEYRALERLEHDIVRDEQNLKKSEQEEENQRILRERSKIELETLKAEVSALMRQFTETFLAEYEKESAPNIARQIKELEAALRELTNRYQKEEAQLNVLKADFSERKGVLKEKERQLRELQNELSGQDYQEESHRKVLEGYKNLQQVQKSLNDEVVKMQVNLEQQQKNLLKIKELKEQEEAQSLRLTNLNVLANLFRGKGFVNYISRIYLEQLLSAANERFTRLTREQLKLELREDNSFQVRDFLGGGKLRHIKTLSGGQTFLAAFSLALALSDSIRRKEARSFFFIDEGFGSLDKDSLAEVFKTLKNLHKENRIVGVISHVEALQEEMEYFLRVSNDPEEGTRLEASWE